MDFAIYETEYGNFKIGYENEIIIYMKKLHTDITDYGRKTKLTDLVYNELIEYFNGKRKNFSFKYELRGTPFQIGVWKQLEKIPYGETRTYLDIAKAVGNPKASRAIGMANNKNPITIAVPCHRVIGSNKKLVGYAGGLDMKEKILNLEKENL